MDTELGRVAVLAAFVADSQPGDEPGGLNEQEGHLALATSAGRLVFDEARRAGKRAVSGEEFLRGQRQLVGTMVR